MMNMNKILCVFVFYVSIFRTSLTTDLQSTEVPFLIENHGRSDKHVLDYLLNPKRYDKRLLPPSLGPSIVNISVVLFTISSPDESSLKYDVEFLLEQDWYDKRLMFPNHTNYHVLNGIHHQGEIWLPDTNFHMHGDFKPSQTPTRFSLHIFRDGRVEYTTRRHLSLNCEGMMNEFPFDKPMCTFSMESISFEKSDLIYVWKNNSNILLKSPYLKTSNSHIQHNRTLECVTTGSWRGNYSCLLVEIIFSRNKMFYFATIFIPGMILVTSSFFTFFLSWDAVPARTIIGVTTMLNYFSTSNSFRRSLPDVSNLTAMNVWDGVCMLFVFGSFVEFVVVNSIGRMKVKLKHSCGSEKCRISETKDMNCTECTINACSHPLLINTPERATEKHMDPSNQVHFAKTIDLIARFTFPSTFVMFLVFFFLYYSVYATNYGVSMGNN